jgi:hypothetical protein
LSFERTAFGRRSTPALEGRCAGLDIYTPEAYSAVC